MSGYSRTAFQDFVALNGGGGRISGACNQSQADYVHREAGDEIKGGL